MWRPAGERLGSRAHGAVIPAPLPSPQHRPPASSRQHKRGGPLKGQQPAPSCAAPCPAAARSNPPAQRAPGTVCSFLPCTHTNSTLAGHCSPRWHAHVADHSIDPQLCSRGSVDCGSAGMQVELQHRALLQPGIDERIVVVRDDEPTSLLAYALSSRQAACAALCYRAMWHRRSQA